MVADYLQEMGNFVSEFLKPFGVDVDIKVDHKNEKEKKDETKPPSEPNTSSAEKTTPKAADEPTTSSKHLANLTMVTLLAQYRELQSAGASLLLLK